MCCTYTIHYLECDCDEAGFQCCDKVCRGLDIKYNEDLDEHVNDLCPDHRLNPPQPEQEDEDVSEDDSDGQSAGDDEQAQDGDSG